MHTQVHAGLHRQPRGAARSTPKALRLLRDRPPTPATIDAIMREAGGFRMGPFELMDLIGHDVNYAVTRSVFDAYYQRPALHAVADPA